MERSSLSLNVCVCVWYTFVVVPLAAMRLIKYDSAVSLAGHIHVFWIIIIINKKSGDRKGRRKREFFQPNAHSDGDYDVRCTTTTTMAVKQTRLLLLFDRIIFTQFAMAFGARLGIFCSMPLRSVHARTLYCAIEANEFNFGAMKSKSRQFWTPFGQRQNRH